MVNVHADHVEPSTQGAEARCCKRLERIDASSEFKDARPPCISHVATDYCGYRSSRMGRNATPFSGIPAVNNRHATAGNCSRPRRTIHLSWSVDPAGPGRRTNKGNKTNRGGEARQAKPTEEAKPTWRQILDESESLAQLEDLL